MRWHGSPACRGLLRERHGADRRGRDVGQAVSHADHGDRASEQGPERSRRPTETHFRRRRSLRPGAWREVPARGERCSHDRRGGFERHGDPRLGRAQPWLETGGAFSDVYQVTLRDGDHEANVKIMRLSIVPDVSTIRESYIGVFCDRGATTVGPAASGVTSLDEVTVGPSYYHAVVATTSRQPSGCFLQITSSRIRSSWSGVYAKCDV